jgi:hypothetical protein
MADRTSCGPVLRGHRQARLIGGTCRIVSPTSSFEENRPTRLFRSLRHRSPSTAGIWLFQTSLTISLLQLAFNAIRESGRIGMIDVGGSRFRQKVRPRRLSRWQPTAIGHEASSSQPPRGISILTHPLRAPISVRSRPNFFRSPRSISAISVQSEISNIS